MADHLDELLQQALETFERLTPAQQAHHRHEQRISFAYGNVKLSNAAVTREMVEKAAGPCPCGLCEFHRMLIPRGAQLAAEYFYKNPSNPKMSAQERIHRTYVAGFDAGVRAALELP